MTIANQRYWISVLVLLHERFLMGVLALFSSPYWKNKAQKESQLICFYSWWWGLEGRLSAISRHLHRGKHQDSQTPSRLMLPKPAVKSITPVPSTSLKCCTDVSVLTNEDRGDDIIVLGRLYPDPFPQALGLQFIHLASHSLLASLETIRTTSKIWEINWNSMCKALYLEKHIQS